MAEKLVSDQVAIATSKLSDAIQQLYEAADHAMEVINIHDCNSLEAELKYKAAQVFATISSLKVQYPLPSTILDHAEELFNDEF